MIVVAAHVVVRHEHEHAAGIPSTPGMSLARQPSWWSKALFSMKSTTWSILARGPRDGGACNRSFSRRAVTWVDEGDRVILHERFLPGGYPGGPIA